MDFVRIENFDVGVGQFKLQNINLTIPRGEVMVVLGSSGSGKSVLLESIAGFNRPSHGRIWLDGREVTEEPPEKRQIGFMFQDYALFPHLTVEDNITFSLRFRQQRRHLRQGTSIDPSHIVAMLRIEHLLSRYPTQLSGGEKQRVAMARVLVQQPKLFLLDEPMSALDARTREELREELGGIFKRLGLTVIYVTHDQTEALALADCVCILNAGQVVQFGRKEEVFSRPLNSFTAKFLGMENVFSGVVESMRGVGHTQAHVVQVQGLGFLTIHGAPDAQPFTPGEIVDVGIRPEDILIGVDDDNTSNYQYPTENRLSATITDIIPWGVVYKLHLGGKAVLNAMVTKHQLQQLNLKPQAVLPIFLPPQNLHIMKADS